MSRYTPQAPLALILATSLNIGKKLGYFNENRIFILSKEQVLIVLIKKNT